MIGIDVSKHNGDIDFKKVRDSGIEFVIIRAGYGKSILQKDPKFEENYKKAKAAGLKVGCYWYSYAMNQSEAIEEASVFLKVIEGKIFEMPIYLDFEERKQFNLPKRIINIIIYTFLNHIEKHKYWVGLYMSRFYLDNYVEETIKDRYAIWVAEYAKKVRYKGNYGIWQYTCKGKISGIKGFVDLNIAYIDYKNSIMRARLNGYGNIKDGDTLIDEVIKGYWGNGDIRKQLLGDAGYNYTGVQSLVNKRLGY